jgi:hypothetical protein
MRIRDAATSMLRAVSQCVLPQVQVIAAVGCLARIPLPQGALRPIRVKRSAQPAPTGQRPPQSLSGRPGSMSFWHSSTMRSNLEVL